jgi:queuosine precursor transporter
MIYILMYLLAAVLANLSTAFFGAYASILNAFLFIGLDLTARDKLHDAWQGKYLWWKMFALIAVGSGISYLLNKDAGSIALASLAAFGVAGLVDAIVYQYLHDKPWMVKVNGSNIFSALADSLVFPTIAFGGFLPLIVLGQFAAKVSGGFIWSWIISKVPKK